MPVKIQSNYLTENHMKHLKCVTEPLGDKTVTELPGIDEVLGLRLEAAGFNKAFMLLGMFLTMRKSQDMFEHWLASTCGADASQARDCYLCLADWWDSCQ